MLTLFHGLTRWLSRLVAFLERTYLHFTHPSPYSIVLSTVTDLTRSKADLIAENALLRQQLIVLHRQVKRPTFSPSDRFWLVFLSSRARNWKEALLIFKPDTLLRRHRQGFRLFWKLKSRHHGGRPKLPMETVALIREMAREHRLWGAERIRGELLKLGLTGPKHTIQTYIVRPRPATPTSQTWSTFLKNHAEDIWACDFLPVVDLFSRQAFVFCILALNSRRVVHCAVTRTPSEAWVAQQLREATPFDQGPQYLIRDDDNKFGTRFDELATTSRIAVLRIPGRAPRANAICERFLGSVRRECLVHMLIFSERQWYGVISEYVTYFD